MTGVLSDYLQVWGFEGDFILFADGSIGFGLDCHPIDISCWDDERINSLASRAVQFLNGLPPQTDLQVVQEIRPENGNTISAHGELGDAAKNPVAKMLCDRRVASLTDADARRLIPRHKLKIFVRRATSQVLLQKKGLLSSAKKFVPMAEERLRAELLMAEQLKESISHGLKSLGIEAVSLSADRVVSLMYSQWNPSRPVPLGNYAPEDIRNSILFSDVSLYEQGFSIGGVHHRVLSLKNLPDETFSSMAEVLRDLPLDSSLCLSIHVPDQQSEITNLQAQRRLAFSMARGKSTGVSDIESESKLQDLESLLSQMIAQGEKVFHASMNIILRADDKLDLSTQVSHALMKVRELAGAEAMEESLASFDIFSDIAIPNARSRERVKRVKTSNLADLLPIYGPWNGNGKPSLLLRSRMGSLVSFDPFSKDLSNYNHVISGGSGSGKSFFTNLFLLQMLKENPRIFIIDIGGSYAKLCESLSGQNIALGTDPDLSINPFDLLPGESTPSGQKIKFLVGLVEIMAKEDEASRLPKLERAEIEEAIARVYERSERPCLSVLRDLLRTHSSPEIQRFGRILTPWCGNTHFGKFVDRPTTISLERPIVAFDLKGMDAYPDLQAAALFIITDYVWREVQKDRASQKFLIFDECWKLLEADAGASFIGEVFRTFRKYYASAIAISQNIDDFAKSKISTAILSNSALKWILMQKGADQARLKEVLQLNPSEMDLISSLHQDRGLYSEVFLQADSARSVLAIEPIPLEYWLATTDPRDLAEIEKRQKENSTFSLLEILMLLSEKLPRGVAASR